MDHCVHTKLLVDCVCMHVCVSDGNVDVIYVSPVAVSDEMTQYYSRLLGLFPAIQSGNVSDQADLSSRFRIITPEAVKPFCVSYSARRM